jgi:trk system potassium uptake protein TrkH
MLLRTGKEDIKVSLKDAGTILFYSGVSFFIPIILAIILDKNQSNIFYYGISALGLFALGYLLKNYINAKKETENKHALLSIVIIWIVYCFFASLPFMFILGISPLDAYFESMSTLTTTGMSLIKPMLDITPPSLILWRTFLGWVGGIGIVLMALIGLMTTYSKTIKFLTAEGRGDQLKENLKTSVWKISGIYILLTIVGIILLMFAGQNLWEATNYSMSAISTNGMDITSSGLTVVNNGWSNTGVNNYWVNLVLVIIMIFGAMSFSLHYLFIKKRNFFVYFKDPEFRLLILLGLIGTLITSAKLGLLSGFFHTFSLITCGGFALVETSVIGGWEEFIKFFWLPLIIIGGAAGSTAGGIKISRFIIFCKSIYWKVKESILPSGSYFRRRYNGENINQKQVKEVNQFILLWIIFIIIGALVISSFGYGVADALFEVASAQSNAGISTGITSIDAHPVVKTMLIINMFVGRLEIIPLLSGIGLLLGLKKLN